MSIFRWTSYSLLRHGTAPTDGPGSLHEMDHGTDPSDQKAILLTWAFRSVSQTGDAVTASASICHLL